MKFGNQTYQGYGAPRIEQARAYGVQHWETTLKPQLSTAQETTRKQYEASLAPQVDKILAVIGPYYTSALDGAVSTYDTYLLPGYTVFWPHVEKAYASAQTFALETGLPYAQTAWTTTMVFADRNIWPKLRILYGENVEPQLIRIGERLGRYRDGRKLQSVMEEINRYTHPAYVEAIRETFVC